MEEAMFEKLQVRAQRVLDDVAALVGTTGNSRIVVETKNGWAIENVSVEVVDAQFSPRGTTRDFTSDFNRNCAPSHQTVQRHGGFKVTMSNGDVMDFLMTIAGADSNGEFTANVHYITKNGSELLAPCRAAFDKAGGMNNLGAAVMAAFSQSNEQLIKKMGELFEKMTYEQGW
jgi:hypothetical protein